MRDFISYVRHTVRILAQHDLWFVLIGLLVLFIMAGWTMAAVLPKDWSSSIGIAQAEVFGSLLTAFVCVGLLDPEQRRGAGEIVFSKPHPPAILLGVRFCLMLLLSFTMLTGLLLIYRFYFHDTALWKALGYALPPCLFVGMVAVTVAQWTRSMAAGIVLPLVFWLWDTTAGITYNPLFLLPAGSLWGTGPDESHHADLVANKITLLLAACLLFWLNVRRLRGTIEASAPRGRSLQTRLRGPMVALSLLFAYFWTGGLANLFLLRQTTTAQNLGGIRLGAANRPGRGQPLIGLNQDMLSHLDVYGPIPLPRLLGPGTALFLRGLGQGLNPEDADYDAQRRAALQSSITASGSLWANHARLELAAMEALPAASTYFAYQYVTRRTEEESGWITIGLIDSAHWWVSRQPTGPDPVDADRLCAQISASHPSPALGAEALHLRAQLAASRWDFVAATADLRQLAFDYPRSPFANEAIQVLSMGQSVGSAKTFQARTRVLAAGKPLPDVFVALAPISSLGQTLPPRVGPEWVKARAAGQFPLGGSRSSSSFEAPDAYQGASLQMLLRQIPNLVARSDAQGNVVWTGVPAGSYALLLHLGSWQLTGHQGRLAPVPPTEPATIRHDNTILPDIRLEPALALTPFQTEHGVPGVRWLPVPGASRYFVALRIDAPGQTMGSQAAEQGGAAPEIEPGLVWWRDNVTQTSLVLTPEQFVGPAEDRRSNGLTGGVPYVWMVEARDASGKILATSETLLPPPTITGVEWNALQPATAGRRDGPPPPTFLRTSGLMTLPTAAMASRQEAEAASQSFESPFLNLLTNTSAPVRVVPPEILRRQPFPQKSGPGQGLPPRPALRTPLR